MRAILGLALVMIVCQRAIAGDPIAIIDTPWGQTVDGLCTRVLLLTKEPKVGQPLKVSFEVRNTGKVPRTFDDQQASVNSSMNVKGPDGKHVPYIATSYQTMGEKTTLAAGASKVVIKELDVAQQYLLDKEGKHTMQFRDRNGLPASNELAVTLKPGELADAMKLFASVLWATPAGWRAARYDNSIVMLNTPTNLKSDATSVSLVFTKDDQAPGQNLKIVPTKLGNTKLGHAWLVLEPKAAERWPDHVKFFETQLKPFATSK